MQKKLSRFLATFAFIFLVGTSGAAAEDYFLYRVKPGDSPWLISRNFNVPLDKLLSINGLNMNSIIYVDQNLKIPQASNSNNTNTNTNTNTNNTNDTKPSNNTKDITYKTHIVEKGDSAWKISIKYGIPMNELLNANNLTEKSILYVGQQLKVPVHNLPPPSNSNSQYGELLDWWTEVQYIWPIGTVATVTDFYTKKSWKMLRSYGVNHADVEPLTAKDTAIMKEIWGEWSWKTRPVIVEVNGYRIAASASAMPHSIETITDNNFKGHSDIHFLNSRKHYDNKVDEYHQKCVLIAGGKQN